MFWTFSPNGLLAPPSRQRRLTSALIFKRDKKLHYSNTFITIFHFCSLLVFYTVLRSFLTRHFDLTMGNWLYLFELILRFPKSWISYVYIQSCRVMSLTFRGGIKYRTLFPEISYFEKCYAEKRLTWKIKYCLRKYVTSRNCITSHDFVYFPS